MFTNEIQMLAELVSTITELPVSFAGFSFEQAYGSIGREYIHVHHLVPLSAVGEEYQVDPISDLRPICPNCHAMVHRKQPPYSVEEVRQMLETQAALNP